MKAFNWKKTLFFLVLMGGLYYITDSFCVSLGVLLLLFVADALIWEWEENRKIRKRMEEGER